MSDLKTNIPALDSHTVVQNEYRCYTASTRYQCNYTWTIQNFRLYEGQERRSTLKSSTFSAGEGTCEWFLELITTNARYNNALYLKTSNNNTKLTNFGSIIGELRFSIIDSNGQKQNTCIRKILIDSDDNSSYANDLIPDSVFNDEKLCPRGELTIYCTVSYIHQKSTNRVYNQCNMIHSNLHNPMEDFGNLFNNQELSDVTIYVGNEKYSAHRIILAARSSVFKAMFTHDMKEKQSNRIDIDDIEGKLFLEVLRYIYAGKVENIETMAFGLLLAADKYDLGILKMMCENELCAMLAADTAVKILLFSNNYNLQDLKTRAIQCVKMNLVKIASSEDWNDLASHPDLMKAVIEA